VCRAFAYHSPFKNNAHPMPTHLPSTLHQLRVAQAELASLPAERVS